MNKGVIAYFAENRVAANLIMVFLIVGGLVAATQISIKLYPPLDLRTITVTIPSPGASPREVEQDINQRVEQSLIGIDGVDRVISSATQGVGNVLIELKTFADSETLLAEIKSAIDSIKYFPPIGAEQATVQVEKLNLEVLTIAVSSNSASENELRSIAEGIQSDLLRFPNISHVSLQGVRDREITIELNEEQLRRYSLSFGEITRIIRKESLNLSYGELTSSSGDIVLHSISKRLTGEQFENIPLLTRRTGSIIYLGDVATVRDGFTDREVRSTLNGEPAAFVRINADERQSIKQIAEAVRAWISQQTFPSDISVNIWNDPAKLAIERIQRLISIGLIGLVLVFLSIVLLFDLRIAFWISLGIPLSFLGALLFFGASNLTINIGTIFALFLFIGIVVDDAVVVGENIAAERNRGKNALDAAISGARSMFGPITIGVVTTIIAFTPLYFVTEVRWQSLNVIPVVAVFVLITSLIESFLILPAHLSKDKPWSLSPLREVQNFASHKLQDLQKNIIVPIVSWSVRHTVLTPLICGLVFVASIMLLNTGAVRTIINDESRNVSDNIQVEIRYPVGTSFAATSAAAERIAQAARTTDEQFEGESVRSISVIVGAPALALHESDRSRKVDSGHIASVRVHLNDRTLRKVGVFEFERAWRLNIGDSSEFEKLDFQSSRLRAPPGVAYALMHHDRTELQAAVKDLRSIMESESAIYGIADNMNLGKLHYHFDLTPEGSISGLNPAIIGEQLRSNFHGQEVQRVQRGHEEIQVVVRYPRERRQGVEALATERIQQRNANEIPLSYIAEITESRELASLDRINGEPVGFISGYTDTAVTTPIQMRRKITKLHLPKLLEKYPDLKVEVDGGGRSQLEMLKTLGILVPLVLLAMYVLIAAFLRSYWKPLVIIFGVPTAFSGAVVSHWILGWDFTTMSIFGIIAVSGVIVNDALVILDHYNRLRRESPDLPAIAVASRAMQNRFRAVFLTSLTTVLGLLPLLFERSEELLGLIPFVVSMLGGLVFAGMFTLFIVPTLVMLVEGRTE